MTAYLPSEPILIVEDHHWYRNQLSSLLSEQGYRCEQAGTLEEALKKMEQFNPFLLLLDLKLAGEFKNGWQLAHQAVDKGIPIVVVTGYPSVEAINKAVHEFDIAYFFDKSSLLPDALVSRVAEIARSRTEKLNHNQRQVLFERLVSFFPDSKE